MTYLQRRLGIEHEPIVCYNGALILNDQTEILSTTIQLQNVEKVYEMANEHFVKLGLYYNNEWYVEENTERVRKEIYYTEATPFFRPTAETITDWQQRKVSAHKIMLMGIKDTIDALYPRLVEKLGAHVHLYRSNDTLIEVAPKTVSKLSAIEALLENGNTLDDVIAFGDNYNDLEMLRLSGYGVAVENAREEVKAIADHVTNANTEDGVAQFIKEHLVI